MILSTTIIGVCHKGKVAIGGDGQVTVENTIMKHSANKIRKLYNNKVLAGFAGSAADAITLFERFEKKLDESHGNLQKSVINLAKDWRTDKVLRRLEALLIVLNKESAYLISGSGDVIEPDDGIVAIGSGGAYALASARTLKKHTNLNAREIVEESLRIASSICVYTNDNITIETF
ncbi:ATP-dependent protease subunit HslV [candidate division WOR-3 bacterium]|nr:ATP-dependent protease subunit HslV [candidate division WOR-3 bacterium]